MNQLRRRGGLPGHSDELPGERMIGTAIAAIRRRVGEMKPRGLPSYTALDGFRPDFALWTVAATVVRLPTIPVESGPERTLTRRHRRQ